LYSLSFKHRELVWGQGSEAAVRAEVIVIVVPRFDDLACLGETEEHVLVKAFISQPTVEALESATRLPIGRHGSFDRTLPGQAAGRLDASTAIARADVNRLARRTLEARKVSFASMEKAIMQTDMEYGAITPIDLPEDWPILIDKRVDDADRDYRKRHEKIENHRSWKPARLIAERTNSRRIGADEVNG
jgi:aminoacyl-tRNA editing protein